MKVLFNLYENPNFSEAQRGAEDGVNSLSPLYAVTNAKTAAACGPSYSSQMRRKKRRPGSPGRGWADRKLVCPRTAAGAWCWEAPAVLPAWLPGSGGLGARQGRTTRVGGSHLVRSRGPSPWSIPWQLACPTCSLTDKHLAVSFYVKSSCPHSLKYLL